MVIKNIRFLTNLFWFDLSKINLWIWIVSMAPIPYMGVHGPYIIPLEKWFEVIKLYVASKKKPSTE